VIDVNQEISPTYFYVVSVATQVAFVKVSILSEGEIIDFKVTLTFSLISSLFS